LGGRAPPIAQAKSLTMCWAASDPANALVELDKDFTKLTGIEMKHEFVPWTSYADHSINLLNSRSSECDLIIGDSQWIGGTAENKRYVKLNDEIAPTRRPYLLDMSRSFSKSVIFPPRSAPPF
jgi:multiple sugar transport system substrate-binding protein